MAVDHSYEMASRGIPAKMQARAGSSTRDPDSDPTLCRLLKRMAVIADRLSADIGSVDDFADRLGTPPVPQLAGEDPDAGFSPGTIGELERLVVNLDHLSNRLDAAARRLTQVA